jgi:hypothetical protein
VKYFSAPKEPWRLLIRLVEPAAARLKEEENAPAFAPFPSVGGIPAALSETRDMIEGLDA